MDVMLASTTFATLVSLLADYVAHRSANENKSYEDFVSWLSANRHDELRAALDKNALATLEIKALLNEGQSELLTKLRSLDLAMASLVAGLKPYQALATAIHPDAALSKQALSLLKQFSDSGATKVLLVHCLSDPSVLALVDGPNGGELKYDEPRFLEDDLASLVELGLLGLEFNGRGDHLYVLRRSAIRFLGNLSDLNYEPV